MPNQKVKKISDLSLVEVSGSFTARGSEAEFYELGNSKYGIKLYKYFRLANESYERQKLAAEHGLAPKVGKMIIATKKNSSKKIYYGYQTEKAANIEEEDDIYKEQKTGLCESLRGLGIGGDFVYLNCGVLDAKLVAVDFGSHSKSNW